MGRNTTRIQKLTRVTTLAEGDVLPTGPASGDRAKGITFSDFQKLLETQGSETIVEVTATYLVLITDDIVIGTGAFTINLPPVATAIKSLILKSVLEGGTITVDPDSTETIEGASTTTLTAGTSITIVPSSTGWLIV